MKIFSGLLGFIVIAVALTFALANRQTAVVSLWPLGVEIQAPLYLLTLGTLLFGVLIGAAVAWFNLLPHRFKARRMRKDLVALQDKVASLQQTVVPPVVPVQGHDGISRLPDLAPKRPFWGSR